MKKLLFFSLITLVFLLATRVQGQMSPAVERAYDDFYTEVAKVYQIIESENVQSALNKIDDLKPTIERKAQVLVDLVGDDTELLEYLDSDESIELFMDKPYYEEMVRILQNETFQEKLMSNPVLQSKIEELESIMESYDDPGEDSPGEMSEMASGIAMRITMNGSPPFKGTYSISADFEESAVAFIDDLDYLRIEIYGDADGREASASFFVDNTGTGKQEWATEGQFYFEIMDGDGEIIASLYSSEEMGFFDITSVDGPGGFVTGRIEGQCGDGNGEYEDLIPFTADFRVGYVEFDY